MNRHPYIGVTGFMKREDVERVLGSMPENSRRLLMVGVLASYKTLNGQPPGNPNRYPDIHAIKNIFIDHPKALNLIHYNTKETDSLLLQLHSLVEEGGRNLHGFQLNICWPPARQLLRFKETHPDMRMVLQISEKAFAAAEYSAEKLSSRIKEYKDSITDVLLDMSGGTGKAMRPDFMDYYISHIQNSCPGVMIGIAGGLGLYTLSAIEQIAVKYPHISIDAEGRLRDHTTDVLLTDIALSYVERSLEILR